MDISTILSAAKVHVSSLNARSTADGFALISLAVDVSDSQQLQAVMRRLEPDLRGHACYPPRRVKECASGATLFP